MARLLAGAVAPRSLEHELDAAILLHLGLALTGGLERALGDHLHALGRHAEVLEEALLELDGGRPDPTSVTVSAELNALAQDYADQLAAAGEITHDLTGTLRIRLTRAGYAFLMASENIGGGYRSIDEAFERWSASRTHLSNMLLPVTQVGIATGFNIRSPYRTFWVLILAYPG